MNNDMDVQSLINSGMAWRLEGFTGRQCMDAIESGVAILGPEGNTDYWGNYVPARTEVQKGTKGSVQYANRIRKRHDLRAIRGQDFDNGYGYELMEDY